MKFNVGDKAMYRINSISFISVTIVAFIGIDPCAGEIYRLEKNGRYYHTSENDLSLISSSLLTLSENELKMKPLDETKVKTCECGKDKHGFGSHSNWCDLYKG
jgi:hypothetical protein